MEEKQLVFEEPQKPEIEDLKKIVVDTTDFEEPEKAEAIIKNLDLKVNDTIKEYDSGDSYIINPKMVLEGTAPGEYKALIKNVKIVLTLKEIYSISRYLKAKKENEKRSNKIYYAIQKRIDKFYKNSEVREDIKDKDVYNALIELKKDTNGIYNTIYHLLSKDKQDFLICYKTAWENKPIPNMQTWREENDGEYRVLTDSEADTAAYDSLEDDYLWKQAVENDSTTMSQEEWKQHVIDMDGRGSQLNHYDGVEEYEDINETTYYIYRTN